MSKLSGQIKLEYLIRELVWTSTLHYGKIEALMEGMGWILLNWQIEIIEMPKYPKEYCFTTEARGFYKFYAMRDFIIYDGERETLRVKTLWSIIDLEKRSLIRIPESLTPYFPSLDRQTLKAYQFEIENLDQGQIIPIKIQNGDIDSNGHVSNAVYFKWFEESLSFEDYSNLLYEAIKLTYKKEILMDEKIGYRMEKLKGEIIFEVLSMETKEVKASMELKYR